MEANLGERGGERQDIGSQEQKEKTCGMPEDGLVENGRIAKDFHEGCQVPGGGRRREEDKHKER
eukprot:767906-Hanusia_phi.AAC.2